MEDNELKANVKRAQIRVKLAETALKLAKSKRRKDLRRFKKLKDAGDVVVIS